ncbi:MAG TPA: hypothetical protein VFS43_33440 [Polyangiaceae bacterium]|nr:hypothetical protein [Polyangiaceae bacterium]
MRVVLLDEARWQFESDDGWWREHRDAQSLFAEEFERTLRHLSTVPGAGQRYRLTRGKLIQRWLMKKTGCHVYYHHDRERELVEIHAIWGARRGRGPRL